MWRMNYTILMNLARLPKILATMHRMIDRQDLYSEQDNYNYVRYITGLMQKPTMSRPCLMVPKTYRKKVVTCCAQIIRENTMPTVSFPSTKSPCPW